MVMTDSLKARVHRGARGPKTRRAPGLRPGARGGELGVAQLSPASRTAGMSFIDDQRRREAAHGREAGHLISPSYIFTLANEYEIRKSDSRSSVRDTCDARGV